jgi:hypothetical protein
VKKKVQPEEEKPKEKPEKDIFSCDDILVSSIDFKFAF